MPKLFEYTAVGRYYKVCLDGQYVSQHTTEREALERSNEIKCDNPDSDVRYVHEYEVDVALTDAGITVARDYGAAVDQPPTITSTPSPYFVEGTPATYDMTQHVSDDGLSTVTYGLSNTLPNGLTISSSTGILSYDGIGIPTVSQHVLVVTDAVDTVVSGSFNIEIAAASSTYTPTHFVAPYASVSGATSDYDNFAVSGTGTAFSAATTVGNPCTFATALAAATAGNVVECAEGIYTGLDYGDRWVGSFMNANSGSIGNPIIFYAKYPAATNYGSTSLYSEIRRPVTDLMVDSSPALQVNDGSSDIIYDGFYANETHVIPGAVSGMFGLHGATRCEYRRIAADRRTYEYPNGGNYGIMYLQTTTGCRIADCYFQGNVGFNNWNDANFEIYGCEDLIIEHSTWENARYCMYLKARTYGPTNEQTPTVRYCKFINCFNGPVHKDHGLMPFHNNLIIAQETGMYENTNLLTSLALTNAYNNTIVIYGSGAPTTGPGGILIADATYNGSIYRDNLVYLRSGAHSTIPLVSRAASSYTSLSEFTMNDNHYYDANSTPTWINEGTTYSDLATWVGATGKDVDSTEGDPLFVDANADNYRLQFGSPALSGEGSRTTTAGCYITGTEEIGVRANPTY